MIPADSPPRFSHTPHLVALVAEVERLAALLDAAPAPALASVARDLLAEAAVATLQLDGSPIGAPPAEVLDALVPSPSRSAADPPARDRRGTWIDAIRLEALDEVPDEAIIAREFGNVLTALDSDDLTDTLVADLPTALATLHRRLTGGLVDEGVAGVLRRSDQTVQDSSVGRIIYFAAPPAELATRLHVLGGWLASAAAREHGLIVSGVVHQVLLQIHPFESANGRLARTVARLLLRARDLDPAGAAGPEVALATDALGYYEEVARTARRRDLTIWLERWGEAVSAGLRRAADRLDLLTPDVPARAERFVAARRGGGFTIADYRAEAGVGPDDARADLGALLDAGRVIRVPGARGLRFTTNP